MIIDKLSLCKFRRYHWGSPGKNSLRFSVCVVSIKNNSYIIVWDLTQIINRIWARPLGEEGSINKLVQ